MMSSFNVRLYCVLLSTDIPNNKQYILSSSKEDVEIPFFELESEMLEAMDSSIISKMKTLVFTNDIELLPQLITLHNTDVDSSPDTVNVIYGFLVKHTPNIDSDKVNWQEFNCLKPHKYSNLIMQVIQNLR